MQNIVALSRSFHGHLLITYCEPCSALGIDTEKKAESLLSKSLIFVQNTGSPVQGF